MESHSTDERQVKCSRDRNNDVNATKPNLCYKYMHDRKPGHSYVRGFLEVYSHNAGGYYKSTCLSTAFCRITWLLSTLTNQYLVLIITEASELYQNLTLRKTQHARAQKAAPSARYVVSGTGCFAFMALLQT